MYRFEKGDSAIGSIYYFDDQGNPRWVLEQLTLNSSLQGLDFAALGSTLTALFGLMQLL